MPETVHYAELLFLAAEAFGAVWAYRLWCRAGEQSRGAQAHRATVRDEPDVLEAEAMIEIAGDRRRRTAVLVTLFAMGAMLGGWAMFTPHPSKPELLAFTLGAQVVLIGKDALLAWSGWRSYQSGERATALLRRRRQALSRREES